jgi:phage I-like protein
MQLPLPGRTVALAAAPIPGPRVDPRKVDPSSMFSQQAPDHSASDGDDTIAPDAPGQYRPVFELPISADGEPPTEIKLFPKGRFSTRKGDFLFDDEAAASVMINYLDQATELHIDYEHQALVTPPIRAPAAGWYSLELREDGLYAVGIKWTADGYADVKGKRYRYFSPAFDADPDTGRILRLINIALTNLPATKGLQPLVAATARVATSQRSMSMPKPIPKTSKLARDYAKAKLRAILKQLDDAGDADVMDDSADAAMKYKMARALMALLDDSGDDALKLDDAGDTDTDGDGDVMKALAALATKLSPYKDQADVDVGAPVYARPATNKQLDTTPDGVTPSNKPSGPAPNTMSLSEREVVALRQLGAGLIALTGKISPSEALGELAAWKQSHERVVYLSDKVRQIELRERNATFDAELKELVRQGKVTPGFARSEFFSRMRASEDALVQLRAFAKSAPVMPSIADPVMVALDDHATPPPAERLSAEQLRIAHHMGLSEKDIQEHKARREKERQLKAI